MLERSRINSSIKMEASAEATALRMRSREPPHRENKRQKTEQKSEPPASTAAARGLLQWVEGSWTFSNMSRADPMARRPLLRGLRGWRGHLASGQVTDDPATRAGGPFKEVPLSSPRQQSDDDEDDSGGLLHDSILTLDGLVTPSECDHLISAAAAFCEADKQSSGLGLTRIECHVDGVNLDGRSHALANIILTRALYNLEVLRPDLAAEIFADAEDCCDLWFRFSGEEPMLNRYIPGGNFDAHQDGHALTVLVPLSTPDVDFEGGGTAFWSERTIGTDSKSAHSFPPSLVCRPKAGTALFWRGHLTHAGLPVTKGLRHVFVASFNLRPAGYKGSS